MLSAGLHIPLEPSPVNNEQYYKRVPIPGGRIVDRVPVNGVEQPWPSNTVRYVSRRWIGPVHIRAQGIEFTIRYVGVHEHTGSGRYPLHTHPHSEFIFTLAGKGEIVLPDRRAVEACAPGHLLALPPGRVHHSRWALRDGEPPWRILIVNFDIIVDPSQIPLETGEQVDLAFSPFYEWFFIREGAGIALRGPERPAALNLLNEVGRSLSARPYGICSEIVAGLIRAIALFSRHIRRTGRADGAHVAPPMISKEAALLKARSLMEHGGVLDAGCVARVARTVGMSESHFIREFKRTYGTTPKQYSIGVLMRRAAALIARTDISVKDAASHLGFDDPSSFSRAFSRYHQMSPARYRQTPPAPAQSGP
ncbi:MAG TPA: AraC family transcriptional regulator [Kiritimatiellia bacterium]|nr:AraC family transcriptional regulator [Kiritimatiellia bacterium]